MAEDNDVKLKLAWFLTTKEPVSTRWSLPVTQRADVNSGDVCMTIQKWRSRLNPLCHSKKYLRLLRWVSSIVFCDPAFTCGNRNGLEKNQIWLRSRELGICRWLCAGTSSSCTRETGWTVLIPLLQYVSEYRQWLCSILVADDNNPAWDGGRRHDRCTPTTSESTRLQQEPAHAHLFPSFSSRSVVAAAAM